MNSKVIEIVKSNIKKGMKLFDQEAIRRCIEIWKPIDGYDNYEVSSFGNIKSVKTGNILKPAIKNKYNFVILRKNNKNVNMYIHRLVATAYCANNDNKQYVDHINNDRLYNNANNLRWVSSGENHYNSSLRSTTTTGVKGVHYFKRTGKWVANIQTNGKSIHLGFFDTLEEAKNVRQKKAKELFGEYINKCEL